MRTLALCAGIGGLERGLGMACHARPVAAVERDPAALAVFLSEFPRAKGFTDLETFDGRPWAGHVDLLSAGDPCQPYSHAARGRHVAKSLWPQVFRVILEAAPQVVFIENTVERDNARTDLEAAGFRTSAGWLSAAAVGAPHVRSRAFLLGVHADSYGEPVGTLDAEAPRLPELLEAGRRYWAAPPRAVRLADGIRPHHLGNAVCPFQAAVAFRMLLDSIPERKTQ